MRDDPIPKHMWLKCVRNYDYFTTCVLLSIHIPWKRTKLDKTHSWACFQISNQLNI